MTGNYKAVNSYEQSLIELLETASTKIAPRGELPLFTESPRRLILGNCSAMHIPSPWHSYQFLLSLEFQDMVGLGVDPVGEGVSSRGGAMPLFMDHHKNLEGLTGEAVHREAHGNVADEIVEVKEGS